MCTAICKSYNMRLPKLYIKNDKGMYEPYSIPEHDIDKTMYRRINGKYVPVSMLVDDDIPEGIWVVTSRPSVRSITNGTYLRESFKLDKVADLQRFPMTKIASMKQCVDHILWNERFSIDGKSVHDIVSEVVGMVYKCNDDLSKNDHDTL